VYGVNYYCFPYVTNYGSKHTCMATDGRRIYVQGGDHPNSATDGTWSCDMSGANWQLEVGIPVYPTLPAPHALQDCFGYAPSPQRGKFLLWPGLYFAYEAPGSPILNYTGGVWWYDPVNNSYTQDSRLFANVPTNGVSPGVTSNWSGCVYGGAYDEVKDEILVFADSQYGTPTTKVWSVATMTALPDRPFTIVTDPLKKAVYFTRGRYEKVARQVYIIGYRTDGTTASQDPLLLCWNLDTNSMVELAKPPVSGPLIKDIEIRFGSSKGKIVWPFTNSPDGVVQGIYVYDPSTNVWTQDTQTLPAGFMGNAILSLPDGRIALAGGEFGPQPTMFNFYQLN
jgi:hypothetical protein